MAQDAFAVFCGRVCALVRQKRVHRAITAELTAHMEDRAAALAEAGVPGEEAARRAVDAMGDPGDVGRALDRCYAPLLPRLSQVLLALAVLIFLAGLAIGLQSDRAPFAGLLPRPAADALSFNEYETVLRTGSAAGGGALGDYTLAVGEAALVRCAYPSGAEYDELRVALRATHRRPWLGNLSASALEAAGVPAVFDREWLLGASGYLYLRSPDPARDTFTLELEALGRRVRVRVTLDGEVAP